MRVLNLAISNKSSLACTNFSAFKREQIYVLAYSIQIYVIAYSIQIHVYVIAYSIQIYVIAYSIQIHVIAYSIQIYVIDKPSNPDISTSTEYADYGMDFLLFTGVILSCQLKRMSRIFVFYTDIRTSVLFVVAIFSLNAKFAKISTGNVN